MNKVAVELGERSYEVRIGPGLLARAGAEIAPLLRRKRVAVVTDETVASWHLPELTAALEAEGIASSALALPAGEGTKNWENLARCTEWLLEQKVERKDVVIALGGWWLAASGQEAWTMFALVGLAMVIYGLATVAAIRWTRWGR